MWSISLIKQETKNRDEDAPCALKFMSDAEDNEAQITDSLWSLHENLFLGNLQCLGWYSLWCEFFSLLMEMDTDTVLTDDCFEYCRWSKRGWFRWINDVMFGNSVIVEFRTVCQHCQIPIIDYVSWDVGRETPETHFNKEFFTLFVFSNHVCNGSWLWS